MAVILKDDLLAIQNTIFSPRVEELKTRTLLKQNREFDSYVQEVGFDVYDRTGSAKVLAAGADAKDIPFVGDEVTRFTQKVFTIATGIRYTESELEAVAARRLHSKGGPIQLDQRRPATARRFLLEREHRLAFNGDSDVGIKGLFDSTFYGAKKGTSEDVAEGSFGGTAPQNRLWANKTPQEQIADLNRAMQVVENGNLFKARALVISSNAWNLLKKPYSNQSPMTTLKWLATEGMYFEEVIVTNVVTSTYNGDSVDWFFVCDNDSEIVELITTRDITIGAPVVDIIGTSKQAVTLKTAGVMVRHPAAFYIGKGI